MPQLVYIQENNLLNAPNTNLMPQFAMFSTPFVWNVVSGTATVSYDNTDNIDSYNCLKIRPNPTALVNTGGSQMSLTVQQDGNYIFSLRHRATCPTTNSQDVRVKVYVNGTPTDYIIGASTIYQGAWRTYYQVIENLSTGDVIDFAFGFDNPALGGIFKHSFNALKFEFDAYGFGVPTVFSSPLPRILQTSATIDVPSISSNSYYEISTTLTGAEVGDFVTMNYPTEIITLGIIVGYPVVTATDTVSVLLHNHTGGSVNPTSGVYNFKIVK